ncbi:succinyl-diaminopimelate desuccinylase [Caminicella sporogenes DSM 14501]|uniref:Succinyl-diaminopimelate desuccinylase n=1 Tax=Caminicella sporogenes DSM 14501 TaxID=1121266 RepID=A0A1M6NNQ6_9FIRM|nr:dipeptidase PepV [Caminicella sporogenes]RKD22140.1 dipeptidase PepV [Caminicella sporogenes]SHJ97284.1 succinyl-diaminopimelate desuccinylase [Caminicella sporogenes DSM 14501]
MNLNERIEKMKDEIIKSTQEIIRIKSVKDEPKENMPFGEGIYKCLQYALNLSKSFGFKTKNIDNYAGHAEFGNGDEVVGILVHLDVVPEGDNWTYPPYGSEIHDGKIYGRGAIDDKGPAIAALYAMKALKDSGIKLNKKIRIIFGTDEESGWKGIEYYLKHEKAPDLAFTPDADFPAINGEKGILIFDLNKNFQKNSDNNGVKIIKIKGGNRPNMVPDYCEAHLIYNESLKEKIDKYTKENNVKLELIENNNKKIIKSFGISAHGSLPESGQNAISQLIVFLGTLNLSKGEIADFIKFYNDKIGMEYYGQSIGCGFEDEESGKLIFNVGIIDLNENRVKLSVNVRYPITNTQDDVLTGIEKELIDTGIVLNLHEHMAPIYIPKDHDLIKKLMNVYKDFTGDEREPITIGGGTYARAIKNAVAFGPLFPGEPELAHQRDEYISIENLIKITKIYAHALYELAK